MVVIFLCKGSEAEKWLSVTAEEAKIKEKKESKTPGPSADPNESMMGLMKQMYEDGDDNMKRVRNSFIYLYYLFI